MADLAQDCREETLAMLGKAAKGHLDQDVLSGETAPGELQHQCRLSAVQVMLQLLQRSLIGCVRQKQGKILAKKLFRLSSKQFFRDRIHKTNRLLVIDDDDRIRG